MSNQNQDGQTKKKETIILVDENYQNDLWVTMMLQALLKLGIKARIVVKVETADFGPRRPFSNFVDFGPRRPFSKPPNIVLKANQVLKGTNPSSEHFMIPKIADSPSKPNQKVIKKILEAYEKGHIFR